MGVARDLARGCPKAKLPVTREMMELWARSEGNHIFSRLREMTMFSVSWYGFLRISELLALCVEDVRFEDRGISIFVRRSKTDQHGNGATFFVADSPAVYSAATWMRRYLPERLKVSGSGPLFMISPQAYRSSVKQRLIEIGIPPSQYSTHSFRKGGATEVAKVGVQDYTIQQHGRWKTNCFTRYTRMTRQDTGRTISDALDPLPQPQ